MDNLVDSIVDDTAWADNIAPKTPDIKTGTKNVNPLTDSLRGSIKEMATATWGGYSEGLRKNEAVHLQLEETQITMLVVLDINIEYDQAFILTIASSADPYVFSLAIPPDFNLLQICRSPIGIVFDRWQPTVYTAWEYMKAAAGEIESEVGLGSGHYLPCSNLLILRFKYHWAFLKSSS
jgi:hypothetical protein